MKNKKDKDTLRAFIFGAIYASDSNKPIRIPMELTNLEYLDKIISGELRGISPALKIREWECSICHGDFELCPHQKGKVYDGIKCRRIVNDMEITDISIVDRSKMPRNRIFDLLIISKHNKKKSYIWHGFEVNVEMDRFTDIQNALNKKLIPEKAAHHFSKFFSVNQNGKITYP